MGARSTREYTRAVGEWVVIEQGVGCLYTRVVGGWVVIGQGVSGSLFSSLEVISGHTPWPDPPTPPGCGPRHPLPQPDPLTSPWVWT